MAVYMEFDPSNFFKIVYSLFLVYKILLHFLFLGVCVCFQSENGLLLLKISVFSV